MIRYIVLLILIYTENAVSQSLELESKKCLKYWINEAGKIVRKDKGECLFAASKLDSIQFERKYYFSTNDVGSYLYPFRKYIRWEENAVYLLRQGFRTRTPAAGDPYLFLSKLFDFKADVGESWHVIDSISAYSEVYSLEYKEFDKKIDDSLFYFSYVPSQDENYISEFPARISLYIVSRQGDKMSVVYCHKGLPNILVSSSRSMMKYTFKRLSIIRKWCR